MAPDEAVSLAAKVLSEHLKLFIDLSEVAQQAEVMIEKEDDEKEIEEFEIKVFSRVPLNRMMGEKLFVTFSQHDFSVCYPVMKEGR